MSQCKAYPISTKELGEKCLHQKPTRSFSKFKLEPINLAKLRYVSEFALFLRIWLTKNIITLKLAYMIGHLTCQPSNQYVIWFSQTEV